MVDIVNKTEVSEGGRLEKNGIPCQLHRFLKEGTNLWLLFCMVADPQSMPEHTLCPHCRVSDLLSLYDYLWTSFCLIKTFGYFWLDDCLCLLPFISFVSYQNWTLVESSWALNLNRYRIWLFYVSPWYTWASSMIFLFLIYLKNKGCMEEGI